MSAWDVEAALRRIAGTAVWVVGDIMLDDYIHGEVERVSPEAPVPVVRARGSETRLGGAANVALQVATLGAQVRLCGAIGADEPGRRVQSLCARASIDTSGVVELANRCTTRKLRLLGRGQQLLRVDWEDEAPCARAEVLQILQPLAAADGASAVILSDYAKGVVADELLTEIVSLRKRRGGLLIVDPKRKDFAAYRGADILTPNLRELEAACGHSLDPDNEAAIAATGREVIEAVGLEALVVTRGERGILALTRSGEVVSVPAVRRAVYDVTGAGDTAIAVLATALAAKLTLSEAVILANAAAGVAVGYVGAVAVEGEEMRSALSASPEFKVLSRATLAARAASWRAAGQRIVFTNGCFDLLHSGHVGLLRQAAQLGDVLVLAINSDESVRRLKGPQRPVVPQSERAAMLAALSCVTAVAIFDEDTPLEIIERVRPDVLVKGQDYSVSEVVGRHVVESSGGRVVLLPLVAHRSTSELIPRIREPMMKSSL